MKTVSKLQTTPENKQTQKAETRHALSPFEEFDRYFENFQPRRWLRTSHWDWPNWGELAHFTDRTPKVDIVDREKEILVRAEVPGVEKDKLDITVTDNTITIKGSTHHETKEEKGEYYRSETLHGSFSRTVALPADVDSNGAKAEYKDGIVEITVPKTEKPQRKTVKIE